MFRNRKISYIVGACIGALILLLQVISGTRVVGVIDDSTSFDFTHIAWIFFMISAFIAVALGVAGAVVMMKDKFAKYLNVYGRIYNVSLFLPFIMLIFCLIGDLMVLAALMAESNPDALSSCVIILSPGFYIALVIAIAMPIASHFKKIRKPKGQKQEQS